MLWDVQSSLIVYVTLAQPVVNNVNFIGELVLPHAKICRLDVSMQVLAIVDELHDSNDFNTEGQHSVCSELHLHFRQLEKCVDARAE